MENAMSGQRQDPAEHGAREMDDLDVEQLNRFLTHDEGRIAEIEQCSQHIEVQENMIKELQRKVSELMLDQFVYEQKITEEMELSAIARNMGESNSNLLKDVQKEMEKNHKILETFKEYEKCAKNLNDGKNRAMAEHDEMVANFELEFNSVKSKLDICYDKSRLIRENFVQNADENLTKMEKMTLKAKEILQTLIDSKQLNGSDLPSSNGSITQQIQIAVNSVTQMNQKMAKCIKNQKDKAESLNDLIENCEKEAETKKKVVDEMQLAMEELIKNEEFTLNDFSVLENELTNLFDKLEQEHIKEKEISSDELEKSMNNYKVIISEMWQRIDKENEELKGHKLDAEEKLKNVKELVMKEELERLMMEGRLEEIRSQIQKSKENIQLKLQSYENLESELALYETDVETRDKYYNQEETAIRTTMDQLTVLVSELTAEKTKKDAKILTEAKLIDNLEKQIQQMALEIQQLQKSQQATRIKIEAEETIQLNTLRLEIDDLQKLRQDLTGILQKLRKNYDAFEECSKLQDESRQTCERMVNEMAAIERDGEKKMKLTQMQMQQLQSNLTMLKSQLTNLDICCQVKNFDIETLCKENEKMRKLIQQVQIEYEELKKIRENCEKMNKKLSKSLPKKQKINESSDTHWEMPLYDEMTHKHQGASRSFLKQHNRPYVEYSGFNTDEVSVARKSTKNNVAVEKPTHKLAPTEAVEYKTAGVVRSLHISEDRIVGREFKPHTCSNECVRWTNYPDKSDRKTPPLLYPLLVGFDRHIHRKGKKIVGIAYSTPCGRMIRNIEEMRKYLLTTRCLIGLDMFSFEETINVTNQFAISPGFCKYYEEDISFGAENIGIQCINEVTPTKPDPFIYSTVRLPLDGVYINTDPAFRVCCDCVDDCNDREKCACWQLTLSAPEGINKVLGMSSYGYTNRRLKHSVITGIYECNSECTCIKKLCQNRVVQFPLSQRLQLFRTLNKGWGLRTLSDIPHGAFICIYVGQLLNEKRANEDGRKYGDEYFAELDFIETAEQTKEDYEHGVDTSGADEFFDLEKRQMDEDKEFIPNGVGDVRNVGRSVNTRSQNKATTSCDTSNSQQDDDDNDSDELQVTVSSDEPEKPAPPSFRKFFGPNEDVYVMDAKKKGNIGRYLNHSCDPNTFVQNVFIDTHDPRFPWVAFFASVDIKAGTELTWDYNYVLNENGSRRLYCYCGTSMCRKYLI